MLRSVRRVRVRRRNGGRGMKRMSEYLACVSLSLQEPYTCVHGMHAVMDRHFEICEDVFIVHTVKSCIQFLIFFFLPLPLFFVPLFFSSISPLCISFSSVHTFRVCSSLLASILPLSFLHSFNHSFSLHSLV